MGTKLEFRSDSQQYWDDVTNQYPEPEYAGQVRYRHRFGPYRLTGSPIPMPNVDPEGTKSWDKYARNRYAWSLTIYAPWGSLRDTLDIQANSLVQWLDEAPFREAERAIFNWSLGHG